MDLEPFISVSRQYLQTHQQRSVREVDMHRLFGHRLSILVGARGVGKTTLLTQYGLRQVKGDIFNKRLLYLPLDHILFQKTALYDVIERFVLLGGSLLILDEIHRYEKWSIVLKSVYDTFPELHILASGSSALEIHKGSHDLTRRAVVNTLHGLSLREYFLLKHQIRMPAFTLDKTLHDHERITAKIIQKLKDCSLKVLPVFYEYLQQGYFPYFLDMPSLAHYQMTLEQNLQATLESDIPNAHPELTGVAVRKMKQLLAFIADNVPFIANLQKLRELSAIGDNRTLKLYLNYLEDAGLIRLLLKQTDKLRGLEAPEKIYLHNPNQYFAFAKGKENVGSLRELFFLSMLSHKHEVAAPKTTDFQVVQYRFEVGGKSKSFSQVKDQNNAFLVLDEIEHGVGNKIPLWLFGFLY